MLKASLNSSFCPCIHKPSHFVIEGNQVGQAVGKLMLNLPTFFSQFSSQILERSMIQSQGQWWCSCLGTNTLANVFIVVLLSYFNTQKILTARSKSSLPLMPMLILPGVFCHQCWLLHNQLRMKY